VQQGARRLAGVLRMQLQPQCHVARVGWLCQMPPRLVASCNRRAEPVAAATARVHTAVCQQESRDHAFNQANH
jgi:hypothetical protein